ncbi:MAG: tetratricopeptide repeat protein [Nitrospirae bacterium]|nr:tetratricopeptide repeat protein [Candidatus Manganitrophaceae bacterium]
MLRLSSSSSAYSRWVLLLIPLLVCLVYSNTWDASFHLDDEMNIVENRVVQIKTITPSSLYQAGFQSPLPNRFVANISFALNYYLGGLHVSGYHAVNLLIHLITALLLALFLYRTLTLPSVRGAVPFPGEAATVAALLWAIHPIQTESVTYIVQRMTSLSALFYLLALVLFVSGRRRSEEGRSDGPRPFFWYLCALMSALLSLGSKETAITLPLFVALYDLLFFRGGEWGKIKRVLPFYAVLFTATVLLAFFYLGGTPGELREGISKQYGVDQIPPAIRLMTESRVLLYYVSLLLFPHPARLNLDYDFPLSGGLLYPWTTLLSILFLIGVMSYGFYGWRRRPLLSFFIFWYVGNLFLESSVLQLDLVFEHRLYLPSIAFFTGVGVGLARLRALPPSKQASVLASVVLVSLIGVYSFWTFDRNRIWKNEVTLWEDTVSKSPKKARPFKALGTAYAEEGRLDESITAFLTALRLNENYAKAHTNLGVAYYKSGRTVPAISEFQRAIEINERDALAYYNLANIFTDQGRWDDAIIVYRKALEILPVEPMIRHNLAYALSQKGMRREAIHQYLEAIRAENSRVETHKNLAALYFQEDEVEEALHHYQEATQIQPNDPAVHRMIGQIYKKQRRFDLALQAFSKSADLQPNPVSYYQMGTLFDQKKEWDRAAHAYEKATQLDPKMVEAYINLGIAYQKEEKLDESMRAFLAAMRLRPDLPEAHNNLGFLYQQRGLVDLARFEYQSALHFRPEWDLPRLNLTNLGVVQQSALHRP